MKILTIIITLIALIQHLNARIGDTYDEMIESLGYPIDTTQINDGKQVVAHWRLQNTFDYIVYFNRETKVSTIEVMKGTDVFQYFLNRQGENFAKQRDGVLFLNESLASNILAKDIHSNGSVLAYSFGDSSVALNEEGLNWGKEWFFKLMRELEVKKEKVKPKQEGVAKPSGKPRISWTNYRPSFKRGRSGSYYGDITYRIEITNPSNKTVRFVVYADGYNSRGARENIENLSGIIGPKETKRFSFNEIIPNETWYNITKWDYRLYTTD